jgi:WD40 repeat protein/DNA-binding SARP family transcriptional activator
MKANLLGSVEVTNGGGPVPLGGPRARALLAHLLLRPDRLVSTDGLIDAIWGDDPPRTARNALHTYASHLRKALGPNRLEGRTGGYILHLDPAEIDAFRFEALLDEARGLATSDPAGATRRYREALALWRGPALEDLADVPSLRPTIARLEELRLAATEELMAAELELGRHTELVPELETLVALHPLRERLWGHLMVALYRSGRQGDALGAFLRAREILAEELGIDPSPDLQRLQEQILRQDTSLETAGEPLRGYRLLERIGAGAFGTVHRGFQPQVGREVAVKVIHPELANDAEFIRRFETEAQMVARLEHPHVVPLYDYWREPDGAYLVMRFLRGGSLRDALSEGALEPARATAMIDQIGLALAAAHRQGIVHRDVKPANLLLDEEGNAYLSDFGIAKDLLAPGLPAKGGTPSPFAYYISPEELHGEAPTPRSDIYSLGLVLYEMLAGRHAYADAPPETLAERQLRESVPPLAATRPGLPATLDDVIRRATAKEPGDRYPDVADFVTAVRTALGGAGKSVVPVGTTSHRNPYKGLHPFLEADAADFFGREGLVERLLARMAEVAGKPRLLGVVGPSGSGKSSVVRAGLIPALRRGALPGSERWFIIDMVPGAHPFEELASALSRVAIDPPAGLVDVLEADGSGLVRAIEDVLPEDAELVVVIDQFEELFTLVEDEDVRTRFLAAIHAAVSSPGSRVWGVVTLRADFYDRPLLYKPFGDVLAACSEAITPLSPEEVERAVSGPAEAAGVISDPALLAGIVADVAARPGALPLLQYALLELFDRRSDGLLNQEAYREIGGISGALATRAEDLYGRLSEAGKEAARQLFLRLVALGEDGGEDTRRRVLRGELASLEVDAESMEAVVDSFGARRLLFFDRDPATRGPTVEVAHEALLREWGRLRGWIEAAREDVRTHRRLAAAAAEWTEGGREASFLLRGDRLARFEAWSQTSRLALTRDEREYLQAALARREAEQEEEEARQAREAALERRSIIRLRALVAVFAALALVASGLTALTLNQRERAEREARIATARGLAAAAVANLDVDPERSILLALEAVDRTRSVDGSVLPEAEEALHRAIVASRIVLRASDVGGEVTWSPDGSVFVTEGPENSGLIDVRDAETGASLRRWRGHDVDVTGVAFNHDGSMLATTGKDGALRVWNPATGEELAVMAGARPHDTVTGPSFSPDGSLVAAGWPTEGVVRILELSSGEIMGIEAPVHWGTSFSPDGTRLAVTIEEPDLPRTVVIVEVETGEEVFSLEGHGDPSLHVGWSPDRRWIATASFDQTARIWDAETGEPRFTLHGHAGGVMNLDWSHDGKRLVTGSQDGTAKLWEVDVAATREVLSLAAQDTRTGVWGVAFSPDSDHVMTGAGGITPAVQIWDVSLGGGAQWGNFPVGSSAYSGVAFTPGGDLVTHEEGALRIWDLETGEGVRRIGVDDHISRVEVSPDGELIAGLSSEEVTVWDAASGERVFSHPSSPSDVWVQDVAWSPDGTRLALPSDRGGIVVVDRAGQEVVFLEDPGFEFWDLAFSPDGRLLGGATWFHRFFDLDASRVKIWDWGRGEIIHEIPTASVGISFGPGGERIATANAFEGLGHVWDLTNGEPLTDLAGHTGFLSGIEFSPDGAIVATWSMDGTVRLWDADSGRQELVLRGHEDEVFQARFSPDGSRLASSSLDGTARVWALDLDDLIDIANRKLTRDLTDDECRQYLRQHPCPTS